jgi:hypothetical protein
MIEGSQFPKKTFNGSLVGQIECVPFRFAAHTCDGFLNPLCVARSDNRLCALLNYLLRHRKTYPR